MQRRFLVANLLIGFWAGAVGADELPSQRTIAARVNGEAVYAAEAEVELRLASGERQIGDAERPKLLKAALEQVIDRRLVVAYLERVGQGASAQDVSLALAQFEKELKSQNLTLAEHCQRVGLTVEEMRRSLAWKLSWQRYLEKYLTEQNLEKYFQSHRREFDGTQLRVAQILFKSVPDADKVSVSGTKDRATQLNQEIVAGKISFADAAKKRSEAPSSREGGDIGWIERRQPMPEEFSRVAYALKVGDVSEPFVSPFGVHLITVLEEKSGTKQWREVEAELRPAVTLYLFRWIADKERAATRIELVQ